MVYKLIVLVGLGTYLEYDEKNVEVKEWIEPLKSKTKITRERAEEKIKELKGEYPNIIMAVIMQSSKVKLSNGSKRKILATREDGKWT